MIWEIAFGVAMILVAALCVWRGDSLRDCGMLIFFVWALCLWSRHIGMPVPDIYLVIDVGAAALLAAYGNRCWLSITLSASLLVQAMLHGHGLWNETFHVRPNNAIFAGQLLVLLCGVIWSVYGYRLFPSSLSRIGPWTLLRQRYPTSPAA